MSLSGRLVIVGAGLIGGSIAAGARERGYASYIVGVDADRSALEQGTGLALLDATGMPKDLGPDDLVVIATPTLAVPGVLAELAEGGEPFAGGAAVTDVASVKTTVVDAAAALPGGMPERFVPGHPIAGSERSGIGAARADLFTGRRVILTPAEGTEAAARERVRDLWQSLGAEVSEMDVAEHDRVLAMTSHLPHLLAFALVDTLGREPEHEAIFGLAAGGFRDFTRIASSDATMWADIFTANGAAIVDVLDRLLLDLGELRGLVEAGDHAALHDVMSRAKHLRDAHVPGAGEH